MDNLNWREQNVWRNESKIFGSKKGGKDGLKGGKDGNKSFGKDGIKAFGKDGNKFGKDGKFARDGFGSNKDGSKFGTSYGKDGKIEDRLQESLYSQEFCEEEQNYNRKLDWLMRDNTSESLLRAWGLVHFMFENQHRVLCYMVTLLLNKTQKLGWPELLFDGLILIEKYFLNGFQRRDVDEGISNIWLQLVNIFTVARGYGS